MNVFILLLIIHITCGSISLLSAFGAMAARKGDYWHKMAGRFFFYGMTGVFVTAIPMAILKNNLFLFLIAIFSYYLAFSGWRFARNRFGIPAKLDWAVSILMVLTSVCMLVMAIYLYKINNSRAMVLLVFAIIGGIFALSDLKTFYGHKAIGKERIAKHLTAMLGATIAAVTAFSVTNIPLQPSILLWLGPTVLLVPIIVWWNNRVLKNKYSYFLEKGVKS